MTGIVGVWSTQTRKPDYGDALVTQMSEDITYRSDDLVDRWSDGHLSVARVHHGVVNPEAQPIFNEDGSVCVVLDGEIFDCGTERRSVRREGHDSRLRANDAEYCLHLYEQYGTEAFARLNGSFLLVVYDRVRHELLLANDRFSSRPLFYHCNGDQLAFGAQLRPLLRLSLLPRRLDLQAVFEFFAFQHVLSDRTYYRDVKVLPPASILQLQDGKASLSRYWTTKYREVPYSEAHYVEALADSLDRAVSRRTRGDHRLGILLSGGLDSRAIVACCDRPVTAFTFGDFENQELRIARRIAQAAGIEHVFVERGLDHYSSLVDRAVDIGDGMARFDNAHAIGLLTAIQPHCEILLDAFGFDIRLKGYYFVHETIRVLGKTIRLPGLSEIPEVGSLDLWKRVPSSMLSLEPSQLFDPQHQGTYNDVVLSSVGEMITSLETQNAQNMVEYPAASSFRSLSASLLVLSVRSQMEQRSVIFDNDLLELALSMPPSLRANGRVLKKALRKLSPELAAIRSANTGLRADLPVWPEWLLLQSKGFLRKMGILSRPRLPHPVYTQGSWQNMGELLRRNAKLSRLMEQTVNDPECIDPGLFNVRAVDSVLHKHMEQEADYTGLLCCLLTFGRWYKKYGPT